MRCLFAEDNPDASDLLALLLEREGWEVVAAKDGREALLIYEKAVEDRRYFDVLILDVVMPRINGIAVGVEVRAIEKQSGIPRAVLVLLTGYDIPTEPEELLKVHFADAYVRKPIDGNELIKKIKELV